MNNIKCKDGGPAFPMPPRPFRFPEPMLWHGGMSMRDWFAGMALINAYTHNKWSIERVASWAYALADAMIAERKERHAEQEGDWGHG